MNYTPVGSLLPCRQRKEKEMAEDGESGRKSSGKPLSETESGVRVAGPGRVGGRMDTLKGERIIERHTGTRAGRVTAREARR
jgi:hypothetical protein